MMTNRNTIPSQGSNRSFQTRIIIELSRTTRAQHHPQEKNRLFAVVAQCTIFFIVNAIIYRY